MIKIPLWKEKILAMSIALAATAPQPSNAQPIAPLAPQFGVNVAGAEFGSVSPGTYGLHYIYPSPEIFDYYQSKGRTLIRLPFKWERIQRSLNAPLDNDEVNRLRAVLQVAGQRKMNVVLDVHNYGRYQFDGEAPAQRQIIGSERVPYSAFADLWSKLALAFKDEPAIYGYGLMNEPHDMGDHARWPRAAQAAIDAIREVDQKTIIMVSGDDWSSSRSWRTGINETLNEKVRDPQNNLVYESHCYFDKDNSGSYKKSYDEEGGSPNGGVEYVRPFVEWCKEKGVRGFIGEYGVPHTDARWMVTMDRFLSYLHENKMSATYWAAGPWWGNYSLSIEPHDARSLAKITDEKEKANATADRPQMLILQHYPG
jgi:endoglucanase